MFNTLATIKQIAIAEPCSQNWNDMTAAKGGRHCDSCCKTVIDFTVMTNEQIIATLTRENTLCGRLEGWQINSINVQLQTKPKCWYNWKGMVITLTLLFAVASSFGQSKTKTKKLYHKQLVIKATRPKLDSIVVYYPGIKIQQQPMVIFPLNLKTQTDLPREPTYFLGNMISGLNITTVQEQPVGYFRSIEDMMQAVQ